MARNNKKTNLQKCDPSQEKIAFKKAYQQVRCLLNRYQPPKPELKFSNLAYDTVQELVSNMPWSKAEAYHDAIEVYLNYRSKQFELLPPHSRQWRRESNAIKVTGRLGKLPA